MPHRRSLLRGLAIWLRRALSADGARAASDTSKPKHASSGGRPGAQPDDSGGTGSRNRGNKSSGAEERPGGETITTPLAEDVGDGPLSRDLSANIVQIETAWGHAADLVVRRFSLRAGPRAALVFLKGQVDDARLDLSVVRPLQRLQPDAPAPAGPEAAGAPGGAAGGNAAAGDGGGSRATRLKRLLEHLEESALHTIQLELVSSFADAMDRVAHGNALLLVHGENAAIAINVHSRPHRSVEEPGTEQVVRGPREGFIEDLDTNVSLVRARVRHPKLRFLSYRFGRYSQTRVRVLYLEGRAPKALVEEVKRRLDRIQIDAVIESSYIEELIEDAPYSPFPQILQTERPDVAAAALYEGRVAILTDGSPFALIAPITFWSLLQASEDHYQRHLLSSLVRLLRIVLVVSSVTLPALYIAAVIFHHGMLPTPLLITIAASRERVPLPAALEIFLFEVAFEAFREAGVRLPRSVGQTVGIVGGIIIGQAAVQAGLISAPVIVVIALTGLASFATPHVGLAGAMRILRFFLIMMASSFGLYGILIGGGFIQVHLLSLRSFGVPYLWPLSPLDLKAFKDTLVRVPIWSQETGPTPLPEAGPGAVEYTQVTEQPPKPEPPPGPRERRVPRRVGRRG